MLKFDPPPGHGSSGAISSAQVIEAPEGFGVKDLAWDIALRAVFAPVFWYTAIPVTQIFKGPSSAVSKQIFSSKIFFCILFQALHNWHAFVPL